MQPLITEHGLRLFLIALIVVCGAFAGTSELRTWWRHSWRRSQCWRELERRR